MDNQDRELPEDVMKRFNALPYNWRGYIPEEVLLKFIAKVYAEATATGRAEERERIQKAWRDCKTAQDFEEQLYNHSSGTTSLPDQEGREGGTHR